MSHEFESGVFNQVGAWHGLGITYTGDGPLYADTAIKIAHLDWQVEKRPLYTVTGDGKGMVFPENYALVRKSDDKVLSKKSIGKRYLPIQNEDAFKYINDLVDSGEVVIETAISLYGGRVVTIVARRPDTVLIAGEEYIPYIVFTNPHDGSGSAKVFTTLVRVVCANTQRMALEGAKAVHNIPHVASKDLKLQEAREKLGLSFKYTEEFAELAEGLAEERIDGKGFMRFLDQLVPLPDQDEHPKAYKNAQDVRQSIGTIYKYEDNLNDIRGKKLGALQAVIQHNDHARKYKSPERRFEKLLEGSDLNMDALNILTAA